MLVENSGADSPLLRVGIVTNLNGGGGMRTHAQSLVRGLQDCVDLRLFDENPVATIDEADLRRSDFIIRFGWRQDKRMNFSNADFAAHILPARERNILVVNFDATMLRASAIRQINHCFGQLWFDSTHSRAQAGRAGIVAGLLGPVFPPCIMIDRTQDSRTPLRREIRFLTVANELHYVKGVDLVLQAFYDAFSARDAVTLVLKLNEKAPEFDVISPMLQRLATEGRSHQLQIVRSDFALSDMGRLYASVDCYVHLSRCDTFGLPALEAAFCGVGVITHGRGGCSDYIDLLTAINVDAVEDTLPANVWRRNLPAHSIETSISSAAAAMRQFFEGHTIGAHNIDGMRHRYSPKRYSRALVNQFGLGNGACLPS